MENPEKFYAQLTQILEDKVGAEIKSLRNDIAELREEIGGLREEMHQEIGGLREEMHQEIGGLREEMHQEIGGLREEMHQEIGGLREEMRKENSSLRSELFHEIGNLRSSIHQDFDGLRKEMNERINDILFKIDSMRTEMIALELRVDQKFVLVDQRFELVDQKFEWIHDEIAQTKIRMDEIFDGFKLSAEMNREYYAQLKPRIEKLEEDVQQLKDKVNYLLSSEQQGQHE